MWSSQPYETVQRAAAVRSVMSAKGVIRILAGPASIIAILMLVLLLSLAGAELLSDKKTVARQIGGDVAVAKARAVAEAILVDDHTGALDSKGATFSARRYPHALT